MNHAPYESSNRAATSLIATRPFPRTDPLRVSLDTRAMQEVSLVQENRSAARSMPHAHDLPLDLHPEHARPLSPAFLRLVTRLD